MSLELIGKRKGTTNGYVLEEGQSISPSVYTVIKGIQSPMTPNVPLRPSVVEYNCYSEIFFTVS